MVTDTLRATMTILETLHEKKVRAGHLGGRPRSLTFDEILAKGLDVKKTSVIAWACLHFHHNGVR